MTRYQDLILLFLIIIFIIIKSIQCTRTLNYNPPPQFTIDQTITFMMNDVLATPDTSLPQPNLMLLFPPNQAATFSVPARTLSTNWLQMLASLQAFEAGKLTVIDEMLTGQVEIEPPLLGKVLGMYVTSSVEENNSHIVAMKATFGDGEYEDSLRFFGAWQPAETESHIAVVGGTGKYQNANGYAILKSAFTTTDRNKILSVTVHLK